MVGSFLEDWPKIAVFWKLSTVGITLVVFFSLSATWLSCIVVCAIGSGELGSIGSAGPEVSMEPWNPVLAQLRPVKLPSK